MRLPDQRRPLDEVEGFFAYLLVEKGLSASSIRSYRTNLRRFLEWLQPQEVRFDQLALGDLHNWMDNLSRMKLAPATVAHNVSVVRCFFQFLYLDGHIPRQVAEDFHAPHFECQQPHVLSEAEVDLLLRAPNTSTCEGLRDRALLELLYATGLRISEAVSLRLSDVNPVTGIVRCQGKGAHERRVPLGQSAVYWLRKYVNTRAESHSPYLWLNVGSERQPKTRDILDHRGRVAIVVQLSAPMKRARLSRTEAWKIVKRAGALAGLAGVTPHTLRHSFATHLLERGADVGSMQLLLGHACIESTQIYCHVTPQRLREVFNKHHPRARLPVDD